MNKSLLPSGCYDVLPPFARQERELLSTLLSVFDAHGYEEVSPPLLEYTDTLLAGRGAALAQSTLRVMDPEANKVMGLRADMTLQVARIAATRMVHAPLPLRLSYAGNVMRARPEGTERSRQQRQVGIELVGITSPEADAEVLAVAARALLAVGLKDFSVDVQIPSLIPALLAEDVLSNEETEQVFAAVRMKDAGALKAIKLKNGAVIAKLMALSGPVNEVLKALRAMKLQVEAVDHAERVVECVARALPKLRITLDPTESNGLAYHSGVTFSFFASADGAEFGRGGRYAIESEGKTIFATGCTLYVGVLRRELPAPETVKGTVLLEEYFRSGRDLPPV